VLRYDCYRAGVTPFPRRIATINTLNAHHILYLLTQQNEQQAFPSFRGTLAQSSVNTG